jgi:hypothetical protein
VFKTFLAVSLGSPDSKALSIAVNNSFLFSFAAPSDNDLKLGNKLSIAFSNCLALFLELFKSAALAPI